MRKSRLLSAVCAFVTAFSLPVSVHAAFVSADLLTAGDGLLIDDTTNGLQWADWSQISSDISVDDFFSTSSWAGHGFRLATQADLELLFTTAGADNIGYNGSWNIVVGSGGSPANVAAIELLNATTTHHAPYPDTGGNQWVHGVFDNGGDPTLSGYTRFNSEAYQSWGTGIIDIYSNTTSFSTAATFGPAYSILAVRGTTAVPIPASVWLFGSGLLGFVGMARRKKTPDGSNCLDANISASI